VITGGAIAFNGLQAKLAPEQHAAAKQTAPTVEEARVRAEKEEAERQEAQTYASAKQAVESVRSTLVDPDSAVFKDVWAVRARLDGTPEGTFACGSVNARNGFGGYTGYTMFVAIGSTVLTPQDSIFTGVFQTVCLDGKKLFPVQV
jgi:hypothetical protein